METYVDIINHLSMNIRSHGCYLKDIHRGTLDFYAMRRGQLVFLCWQFGEEKIEYYHRLNDGISGRRPIDGYF